jgi:large exoprotein involved in heme utilization and adhesion
LATATFNSGQGGKIIVNADQLVISGFENDEYSSGIFSIAKNTGNAGTILVKANTLRVNNRGEINAGTSGSGLGGNVDIQANRIILTDNALISAISKGEGDAGQVTVQVGDTLFLLNNSAIETSTQGADGGNISLDSRSYALLINSKITTSVHSAEGDGGNILMNPEFIVMDNGKIIARAVEGRGGNIDINTTGIYRFSQKSSSSIDASSRVGIDGEVSIESPDVDISGNLIVLSADMLNAVGQLQAPCSVQLTKNKSSFIVKPFVGSSASPQDWHSNILVLIPKDEKHSTDLKEKLSATTINMKKNAKITCSNSFIQ